MDGRPRPAGVGLGTRALINRAEVGLISDTHGLLRPEAVAALQGVDAIVHAGDVGPQSILDTLAQIVFQRVDALFEFIQRFFVRARTLSSDRKTD